MHRQKESRGRFHVKIPPSALLNCPLVYVFFRLDYLALGTQDEIRLTCLHF